MSHPPNGHDTSEYKNEYAQPAPFNLFLEDSKVIRLDPALPTNARPESVQLVPGQDLYQICPYGGLRTGDKFTVEIDEEFTDWGHFNSYPRWTASVSVK